MSCLKEELKPMVPLKTLDIIFRRRYVPNTQHYFANRKHAVKEAAKDKKNLLTPFHLPRSEKLLSYIKYSDRKEKLVMRDRLAQPLHLKDNFKIAATRDISERLFLEEPPDDIRAVVEIHPEFYTVIEGRPLRCFDDIKVYVNNIRSYAMNRQQIGYRRDLIMKIEKSLAEEVKEHDNIVSNFKQHIKNFQKFLTEDYKKSCVKVSKAEKVNADLITKNSEFLGYVSKLTILNNILFKLDAIRNILKIYRSYLIFVAPLRWRQQFDETLRSKVQSIQFEEGEFATDNDLIETMDIDKMIEVARIELAKPYPAHLFFKNPEQMMYLFRTMELQSREYLIQLSKTDGPYKILQERIKQLKYVTTHEQDYFQYYIDHINNEIARENYNESHLQNKFYRILNTTFYDSVASPSTLKLKICIEYVYEQVFGKCEEGHQSLQDPMKILEVMYEDYNLRLDSLDFKIVNQAKHDFFAQDLKTMRDAYKAQRELRAFREMTNAMNKAFLPPAKYTRPVFKKFLDKKSRIAMVKAERRKSEMQSGQRPKPKKYKISPEEREGLLMFTNWCEGTNPAPYLKEYYDYVKPAFEWPQRQRFAHTSSIYIYKKILSDHNIVTRFDRRLDMIKRIDGKSTSDCFKKCMVREENSLPIDLMNRSELLLPYKSYAKKQCKDRFLKQISIRPGERYKVRNKELIMGSNKLDDALDPVCSVTDYDEEFFKIINGRPLFHCIPRYKSLTAVIHKRFRMVQEIGYKKDSALNIDINFKLENKIYDLSLRRFSEQAKSFDKFIMEDYKTSMRLLEDEEKLNFKLDAKIAELQSLADESFTIMSRLLGLDYKYSLQLKYGRFLYYLSPHLWRSYNREFARSVEIEAKGFDFGISHDEDTFTVMFEKMRKQCFASPVKSVLYFNQPRDLLDVFNGIEEQLLYHFSRETQLVPHTKLMKDAIRILKQKIDYDSAVVTSSIESFKNLLLLCEERSVQLKYEFSKVLYGFFYEAVGTADVLKFMFHLEFCYNKVFNEKPMNLDMITIAKAIESMYMDYSKRLDAIQSSTVRRAMKKCMEISNQKMDIAQKASKELRLFYRLERQLLKAHNLLSKEGQEVYVQSKKIPKQNIKYNHSKSHVYKRSFQSLNDAELEYLTLFTDWTKNENPALYLQSCNIDKDKMQ